MRAKPSLRGRPIAIAQGESRREIACASRNAGSVVAGMTPKQARAACPGLVVIARDVAAELAATRELLEALETCGPLVEGAAPGVCYFDAASLPSGEAGAIGAALSLVSALGFSCAAGIADDKFTARCAALVAGAGVSIVPPGGSTAFLAPLPIALLALAPGDADRLDLLGLRTLGQLAALPTGPLALRFGERARRYQRLARGDDDERLQPRHETAVFQERFAFDGAVDRLEPVLVAARGCIAAVTARLAGGAQTCDRLDIELEFSTESTTVPVLLAEPSANAETMFHLARIALESREMLESVAAVTARVTPCGQALPQLSLFDGTAASRRAALAATLARLQAALQREEVVLLASTPSRSRLPERMQRATPIESPRDILDSPRDGARARKPNGRSTLNGRIHSTSLNGRVNSTAPYVSGMTTLTSHGAWAPALRLVDPPAPISAPPLAAARAGPFRLSESWWERPIERDYYQLVDSTGALLLVFCDRRDGGWYVQGVFD